MRRSTLSLLACALLLPSMGCRPAKPPARPAPSTAEPVPPATETTSSEGSSSDSNENEEEKTPESEATQRASTFAEHLRPRVVTPGQRPWTLAQRMKRHGVPGVAVGIIDKGSVVFVSGFGVSQKGKSSKVNEHTLFSVGSISKLIAAATVLSLRDQGKIALDQNIQNYLKSWTLPPSTNSKPLTLRMLLSHTAGLNIQGFADLPPQAPVPTTKQSLMGQAPAKNPPLKRIAEAGKTHRYSGGGYLLTQLILEEHSGKPFAELAQETVLAPLGMNRSGFDPATLASAGDIAKAHNGKGSPRALPRGYETMPELAASGLWSSAEDLSKFLAALLSEDPTKGAQVLSPVAKHEMMTPVAPGPHALGPRTEEENGERYFYHVGANESYKAWIEGHPSTGQGLVVLTNGQHGDRLFVEIRNAVADVMGWNINRPFLADKKPLPAAWTKAYAGEYLLSEKAWNPAIEPKAATPYSLRVTQQGDQLSVGAMQGGPTLKLLPMAPDRFAVPDWAVHTGVASLQFHRNAENKVVGATVRMGNQESYLPRVSHDTPQP